MTGDPKEPGTGSGQAPEPEEGTPRSTLEEAGMGLVKALGGALEYVVGKGRTEFESAARTGKVRLEVWQLQRDRDQLLQQVGRDAWSLVQEGVIDHPVLVDACEKVRELEERIAALESGVEPGPPPRAGG